MFRDLGVRFVHQGLKTFAGAIGQVNRAYKNWGRAAIETARANLYAARSAEAEANAYKNKLQRSIENLIKAQKRLSDQLIKTQSNRFDSWIVKQVTSHSDFARVINLVTESSKRRLAIYQQLAQQDKVSISDKNKLNTQLQTEERTTAKLINAFARKLASLVQSESAQKRVYEITKKLVHAYVERKEGVDNLAEATEDYSSALKKSSDATDDHTKKQEAWGRITKLVNGFSQALEIAQSAITVVGTAFGGFASAITYVTGVLGKILGVVGKVAIAIGKTLFNAIRSVISIPVSLIKNFFGAFINSLKRIGEIAIGMNLSRVIWGIGQRIRQAAQEAGAAASEFQAVQIRIEALLTRELTDAGYGAAEAMEMVNVKAKEIVDWVSDISVKSMFSSEQINQVFALGMAYNFTAEESKGLTKSILQFATGMGLTDNEVSRIIENFGQMRQQGKITGTELRDLARGAFVPINQVLEEMGVNLDLISGVQIPSLERITSGLEQARDAGDLTNEEFDDLITRLDEIKLGSSVTATALKGLYTEGYAGEKVFKMMGISLEDLDKATSDMAFDELTDQLNDLIASGEISVDEFFWAFEEIVARDFPDALEKASTTMKVAKQNIKDFLETMVGWRVLAPIFDVVSEKIANLMNRLMKKDVRDLFDSIGGGLASIVKFGFKASDALFDLSSVGPYFKNFTGIFTNFFNVYKGIGENRGAFINALGDLKSFLHNVGFTTPAIESLEDAFGNIFDMFQDPSGMTFGEMFKTMVKPFGIMWDETIKPELDKLMENIKEFVVTKWNDVIKPALGDFLENVVLPNLNTFITETIPAWASSIATNMPTIISAFSNGLQPALDNLEDWAINNYGENSPIAKVVELIANLNKYIGLSAGGKKAQPKTSVVGGATPFAMELPKAFGPEQSAFEASGLAQTLRDIGDAAETAREQLFNFINDALEPLFTVTDENQASIDYINTFFTTIKTTGESLSQFGGLFADIANLFTMGKAGDEGAGGRKSLFEIAQDIVGDVLEFWNLGSQLITQPVIAEVRSLIRALGEILGLIKDFVSGAYMEEGYQAVNFDYISQPLVDWWNSLTDMYNSTPLEDLETWTEGLGGVSQNILDIHNDLAGADSEPVQILEDLSSGLQEIGNAGNYDKVPFEDMADEIPDSFKNAADEILYKSIVPDLFDDINTFISEYDLSVAGELVTDSLLTGLMTGFEKIMAWWSTVAMPSLTNIDNVFGNYGSGGNIGGVVSGGGNQNINNNYSNKLDNRNITINMGSSAGNLSLDYDYVRAITG